LHCIEEINETLKGNQKVEIEANHPPLGIGNLEGLRYYDSRPQNKDIIRNI